MNMTTDAAATAPQDDEGLVTYWRSWVEAEIEEATPEGCDPDAIPGDADADFTRLARLRWLECALILLAAGERPTDGGAREGIAAALDRVEAELGEINGPGDSPVFVGRAADALEELRALLAAPAEPPHPEEMDLTKEIPEYPTNGWKDDGKGVASWLE